MRYYIGGRKLPRKTKESQELENKNKPEKTVKKATTKKSAVKTTSTVKRKTTTDKKTATIKKKVSTTNKISASNTAKKKTSTKKVESKTSNTRTKKKKVEIVEYYDLPYRYNQTIIKVLAQTPTTLFIYWDISDKDRENFEKQYGDNFFQITKPILIVYNDTLGYSFEVEINDFANSWYLHVADSKCNYRIELARKPITKTEKINTDYIYITTSNQIESPNDKILFDSNQKMVYFRNIKTGKETQKQISSISFLRNMGKIYHIYDLYQAIYQDENISNIYSNPSSSNLSSKFK